MSGTNWHSFYSGKKTSSTEMNDNFAWIQGDLLPFSSGVLADNTHDLGTFAAQWRTLHLSDSITIGGKRLTSAGIVGYGIELTNGVLNVQTSAIRGSSNNEGGGGGREIKLGSLSTPDFRDEAVTSIVSTGTSSYTIGDTTITSATITTIGGKVLVCGHATIGFTGDDSVPTALILSIDRDGTEIAGGVVTKETGAFIGAAVENKIPLSVICVDAQTAGSYVYNLRYTVTDGTVTSISFYGLTVLEMRK